MQDDPHFTDRLIQALQGLRAPEILLAMQQASERLLEDPQASEAKETLEAKLENNPLVQTYAEQNLRLTILESWVHLHELPLPAKDIDRVMKIAMARSYLTSEIRTRLLKQTETCEMRDAILCDEETAKVASGDFIAEAMQQLRKKAADPTKASSPFARKVSKEDEDPPF
jgi:hypothetical protein